MKILKIGVLLLVIGVPMVFIIRTVNRKSDYRKTVQSGYQKIRYARLFDSWYGHENVDHFLTNYGISERRSLEWTTIAYLHQRYEFMMKIEVLVDYDHPENLQVVGDPRFYLRDVYHININKPGGGGSAPYNTVMKPKSFTKDALVLLEENNGDLRSIYKQYKTNSPVKNFSNLREGKRGMDSGINDQ